MRIQYLPYVDLRPCVMMNFTQCEISAVLIDKQEVHLRQTLTTKELKKNGRATFYTTLFGCDITILIA